MGMVSGTQQKADDMVARAIGMIGDLGDFDTGQVSNVSFNLSRVRQTVRIVFGENVLEVEAEPQGGWSVGYVGAERTLSSDRGVFDLIEDELSRRLTVQSAGGG